MQILFFLIVIGAGHSYDGQPIKNTILQVESPKACTLARDEINKRVGKPIADCLNLTVMNVEKSVAL